MRIIAFGDIHGHAEHIGKIEGISKASYVIVTGDLTTFGGREAAKKIIQQIRRYNSNIYAQAGNMDQKEVEIYLSELGINLHGNGFIIEDVGIFGVGGSNPTPFNTPLEYTEKEIENFIQQGYQKVKDAPLKIFIPHAPPFDTKVDMVSGGWHVGSTKIREFIEKYQPQVCATGHIHEARGMDLMGSTTVINPGVLMNGGYIEIIKEGKTLKAELKTIG